jgi:hypothetical protein
MLTITQRPTPAQIASEPRYAPEPEPKPDPGPEPDGFKDSFKGAVRWIAGKAIGLAFGTGTLAANAAAGGARGMITGGRIEKKKDLVFKGAMTLNMAALGALTGGPVGAVLGTIGGHILWRIEGEEVREKVISRADKWVNKTLEKLPGDPEQAGPVRRTVNGAIGEVVGAAGGAWGGTFAMFDKGEQLAHQMTDKLFDE